MTSDVTEMQRHSRAHEDDSKLWCDQCVTFYAKGHKSHHTSTKAHLDNVSDVLKRNIVAAQAVARASSRRDSGISTANASAALQKAVGGSDDRDDDNNDNNNNNFNDGNFDNSGAAGEPRGNVTYFPSVCRHVITHLQLGLSLGMTADDVVAYLGHTVDIDKPFSDELMAGAPVRAYDASQIATIDVGRACDFAPDAHELTLAQEHLLRTVLSTNATRDKTEALLKAIQQSFDRFPTSVSTAKYPSLLIKC